jgi:hypothetical protein
MLVRVSARLSFDDEESFKGAAGSLRFNNPPSASDLNTLQRAGSSSNILPQRGVKLWYNSYEYNDT